MEIILTVLFLVAVAAYALAKMPYKAKEKADEAPYKIESRYESTPYVALPDEFVVPVIGEPIKWTFDNAPKPKPRREYTKRSKYWSTNKPAAKLKKARAAKKKPRKSK